MTDRHCQNPACGKPLTTRNQKRYCSHPCATQGQRTRPTRTVTCPCGSSFTTTDPVKRYCSDECRRTYGAWKRDQVTCLPKSYDRVWRY